MDRSTTIECYMINDKKVIAEMLYDTITKYESRICENCKYFKTPQYKHSVCEKIGNVTVPNNFGCNRWIIKNNLEYKKNS